MQLILICYIREIIETTLESLQNERKADSRL
jgi:hypothetical protein